MRWHRPIALAALALVSDSCSNDSDHSEFYVLIKPAQTSRFTATLESLAREERLEAWTTQATDDRGRTLYVVQAKGRFVTLWAQNMPINALEDSRCAAMGDAEIDPGQFVVTVEASLPLLGASRAESSFSNIRRGLTKLGYKVLKRPLTCSILAGKKQPV